MSSVNKAIILGRIGKDPEVRHISAETSVASFSVATTFRKSKVDEDTEWHRIVAWDNLADVVGKYAKKGDLIYVEGRLRTRKWTDKSGNERDVTEIVAERIQLIGRTAKRDEVEQKTSASPVDTSGGIADMDSDLPFDCPPF
jgi:single-strand DNA-binding protein